jgi:hypothetical protein
MPERFKGLVPESWCCIDCGVNTAPGLLNRVEMEQAVAALGAKWDAGEAVEQHIDCDSEVYTVRAAVWKRAGMEPYGGCLCIGCLEKQIGRALKPKDFLRGHEFNSPHIPGTPRLFRNRYRNSIGTNTTRDHGEK